MLNIIRLYFQIGNKEEYHAKEAVEAIMDCCGTRYCVATFRNERSTSIASRSAIF